MDQGIFGNFPRQRSYTHALSGLSNVDANGLCG
jgi:hypothetical protein